MAREPRRVQSSSSRAVCAAKGNSATSGRETGSSKCLAACDLRGGKLVGIDENTGFIIPKNWTIAGSRHAPELPGTADIIHERAVIATTEINPGLRGVRSTPGLEDGER